MLACKLEPTDIYMILLSQKAKTGTLKDISLAEAGRYGTLNEFAFFDKVSGRGWEKHSSEHMDSMVRSLGKSLNLKWGLESPGN